MSEYVTMQEIDQIGSMIQKRLRHHPTVGIILGSGLGSLAEAVEDAEVIPYAELPNWPVSTVIGHQGRLVVGTLEGVEVLVMQGRVHYYEGYSMNQVTLPIRVMQRIGVKTLIVTNAAGAIRPEYQPGDVMLIADQINLIGMAGLNPLRGPNLDEFGPRFPDMSHSYTPELIELARRAAQANQIHLHEGVYVCLAGPSFETPADLRFLRMIGADAVGMSTVPEVIVARHGGMQVLGFSGISNKANLDGTTETSHEEVLAAGQLIVPKLSSLIRGVLRSYHP
ncbi:MAG TPA: purine-nucleoside phosphorylase [Anaerolineaceae bacterium]|nr:purine-nucleoside phosphorylase [Anaerolineaceae bacterium]